MGRILMMLSGLGAVLLVLIVLLAIWALTGHFEPSHAGPAS